MYELEFDDYEAFEREINQIDPFSDSFVTIEKKSNPLGDAYNYCSNLFSSAKSRLPSVDMKAVEKSFSTETEFSPLDIFNSIRGAENIHIYLWLGLDLGWALGNIPVSIIFGILALGWIGVLAHQAMRVGNTLELYMNMINFIWIYANCVWNFGNVVYNDNGQWSFSAGMLMTVGVFLWLVQKFWLTRYRWLREDVVTIKRFYCSGLRPRHGYLGFTWKQYEHLFIFSWMCIDICWTFNWKIAWIFPTTIASLISLDFFFTCIQQPYMIIDSIHYLVQILWLFSNLYWAGDELWGTSKRDSIPKLNTHSPQSARWVSAWTILVTYIIILCLYWLWILLSVGGYISDSAPTQLQVIRKKPLFTPEDSKVMADNLRNKPLHTVNPMLTDEKEPPIDYTDFL